MHHEALATMRMSHSALILKTAYFRSSDLLNQVLKWRYKATIGREELVVREMRKRRYQS